MAVGKDRHFIYNKNKNMPQINSSCNQPLIDEINKVREKESKTVPISFSQMVETLLQEAIDNRKTKKKRKAKQSK